MIFYLFYFIWYEHIFRCFPHIVNLACKAVLGILTNTKHIDNTQDNYEEYNPDTVYDRDLIANLRSLITSVCSKLFFSYFHVSDAVIGSE